MTALRTCDWRLISGYHRCEGCGAWVAYSRDKPPCPDAGAMLAIEERDAIVREIRLRVFGTFVGGN